MNTHTHQIMLIAVRYTYSVSKNILNVRNEAEMHLACYRAEKFGLFALNVRGKPDQTG